jgi:hypothetical protein
MGTMKIIGVEERAIAAKNALNRLRWEIDWVVERTARGEKVLSNDDVYPALGDIAEALGIMSNIVMILDDMLPREARPDTIDDVFGLPRDRFAASARYYADYHKVGR